MLIGDRWVTTASGRTVTVRHRRRALLATVPDAGPSDVDRDWATLATVGRAAVAEPVVAAEPRSVRRHPEVDVRTTYAHASG